MAEKEYIEREDIKSKKIYSEERHEYVVPVAEIDWMVSADVAPVKHGRWINENFYTHCSVCGKMAIYDKYGQEVESDYCPRCGAKMGGDDE